MRELRLYQVVVCHGEAKTYPPPPMLFYHGDKDDVVPVEYSLMLFHELKRKGFEAEMKILEGFDHNDGIEKAYEDPYLVNWLIDLRRQNFNLIPEFLEEMF